MYINMSVNVKTHTVLRFNVDVQVAEGKVVERYNVEIKLSIIFTYTHWSGNNRFVNPLLFVREFSIIRIYLVSE
jgi:hypothetical protein